MLSLSEEILKDNWNGYGAKAFDKEFVDYCLEIGNNLYFKPVTSITVKVQTSSQ